MVFLTDGNFNVTTDMSAKEIHDTDGQGLTWGYDDPPFVEARARCDELKNVGVAGEDGQNVPVRIFTVGFGAEVNQAGNPAQRTLKYCASSPEDFYLALDADALLSAFTTIADEVGKIRITQ